MKDNWYQIRTRKEVGHLGFATEAAKAVDIPLPWPYRLLACFCKASGLYKRGHANFLKVQLNDHAHPLSVWPREAPALRILQISDLHLDLDPALIGALLPLLPQCTADLCVFTGDFWEGGLADHSPALRDLDRLLEALPEHPLGRYAVLGNHDAAALIQLLQARGVTVLLNTATVIEHSGFRFSLAGIDDAYHFKTHDLLAARRACENGVPSILLSHSPQVALEAAHLGFNFMLSGHTHGGQICWPGGQPLVRMPSIPKSVFTGKWQVDTLTGYTSPGTGTCHLPLRFNCPPEMARHTLKSA
jgi:predicted MPP superfamily phosphohydrolase